MRLAVALAVTMTVPFGCIDFGDLPLDWAEEAADTYAPPPAATDGDARRARPGGDASAPDQSRPPVSCGDTTVELKKLKFRPKTLTICAGDTVTFINKDQVVHNVIQGVPEDGGHDFKSPKLATGQEWKKTFDAPGKVIIYCGTHKKKMRDFVVTVL